jgi:putative endonuclease
MVSPGLAKYGSSPTFWWGFFFITQAYIVAKQPAVYILASKRNGTLYIGVTSDLVKRVWQHRNDLIEGFTKKYGVHRLVYYETHTDMTEAIRREKRLKKWNRAWKIELIQKKNPEWIDLWPNLL